jgi:peptide deformylase
MLGDPVLNKVCREVKEVTPKISTLISDMLETMYDANGVGLAAPQVGVLKRVVTIDVGDGPLIMINPQILASDGTQTAGEGCLSLPGKAGQVTRPNHVVARAYNEQMQEFEIDATELLARAICHEIDHLEGHMYTEFVEGDIYEVEDEGEEE